MDKSDFVTLLVAVMSLAAAIASQRQSAKATRGTNETAIINARTDAETEAYVRARAMDTETINRQGAELKEMRAELVELRDKVEALETKNDELERNHRKVLTDNRRLRERIIELEQAS